jgi:hypothetical protein
VNPLDLLSLAVIAFMGTRLAVAFRRSLSDEGRATIVPIVRGVRPRHVLPIPLVLAAVLVAATLALQVPPLRFGWWSALGGQGNPVFGSTTRTQGTPLEVVVPIVFIVLLLPALPLFARREEELFRLGAEAWSWPRRAWKALQFGLVHALIGIPIGVALALSVGGAYFQLAYLRGYHRSGGSRREALMESTRAHLAYNATIAVLVLAAFTLDAVL